MKSTKFIGFVAALLVHALFLLFGGIFFPHSPRPAAVQQVDLVAEDMDKPKEEKPEEPEEKKEEAVVTEQPDAPPDASAVASSLEQPPASDPGLSAASLSDIEAALNGAAGDDSGFGGGMSFASGGRIGGRGAPGGRPVAEGGDDEAFAVGDLDQKARVLFQNPPAYPSELRGKKIEGVVQVFFIVDAQGRVVDPRIEISPHPAFVKPALDAIRKWKFEPAMRGGRKVASRMKVPIRFASA